MIYLAGSQSHLAKLFPKPEEGETIPVQFIDMQYKLAGWCPEQKRSVYVDDFRNTEGLKRVREVTLLKVYNWILGGTSFIELSEMERRTFEEVMDTFIKYGGEIHFTRITVDGRKVNHFILKDAPLSNKRIDMRTLAEMLDNTNEY